MHHTTSNCDSGTKIEYKLDCSSVDPVRPGQKKYKSLSNTSQSNNILVSTIPINSFLINMPLTAITVGGTGLVVCSPLANNVCLASCGHPTDRIIFRDLTS